MSLLSTPEGESTIKERRLFVSAVLKVENICYDKHSESIETFYFSELLWQTSPFNFYVE